MPEFPQKSKSQISKDRLNIFKKNIQTTKLSKILEAELITKDRVLCEFWNNYSKIISKKLWFPQVIDFRDSEEICSNGYLNNSEQNLQYSIGENLNPVRKSYRTTLWKSSLFSQPDITEEESTRTRKVRFYPNKEQREYFEKCFNTHRYFYNKAVEHAKINKIASHITIRNALPISNSELEHEWMIDIPYDTRQLAIKNFVGSYKASLALLKKGYIKKFEFEFLTKKRSDVFYVNKKALTNDYKIFQRKLKNPKLNFRRKVKKSLLKNSDGDFPIIKDNSGKYYLCIIQKYKNKPKNIESKDHIVALDPGVRTFQTYFSQKECGTIGDKVNETIREINTKIDKLSQIKPKNAKTRYTINKRCMLLRSKITNKVNDLHWKTASFLTKRYRVIFLPIFKTKQMCAKNNNKKVNREMYNLAHYRFKERLKYKAKLNNCTVIDCCESFTSKTCTNCGILNDIGSKKKYSCEKCNHSIDRDLNGARNIFIRCLTKYYTG